MNRLQRFGVSLDKELLLKFDEIIKKRGYKNRSKAISDLIREELVKIEWRQKKKVIGIISLLYSHTKREIVDTLIDIQHHFKGLILSSQHIHLDKNNCLEIIAVKGYPANIQELAYKMKSIKGMKHTFLGMTSTGKHIP